MCAPSPPQPPDPKETAAASTSTNVGTAISNAFLGNVSQVTPEGTLNYNQTGSYQWHDPYTGETYDIPTFTATQTLSPEQEAIRKTSVGTQQNLANIGQEQSAKIGDLLKAPIDLSSGNIENYINTHFADDFNKQWDRERASLEADLANRGIRMGSDAYTRAVQDFETNKSNAYDNLYGNQYGRAQQSILAERNQPINEITALLSGSQVSQPNFIPTNEPTIPTTDVAGLINENYNQKLGLWQQQVAQQQNLLGGLFGLFAGPLGAF